MSEKMFVTVWGLQKAEIEAHCFGSCKKVIFGLLMDEQFGGLSHCFEANCPFVEKEMSEPFGEVNGINAYLRKLQPPNTACSGQGLCPECDSAILPSQYCMMGHWCGERPATNARR